jgi:hypothetical protein
MRLLIRMISEMALAAVVAVAGMLMDLKQKANARKDNSNFSNEVE